MRVAVLFILSVFLAFSSVQAGDYIIVVDASGSMRDQVKVKLDRLPVKRAKRQLVKDQLVEYLEQIPPDGSRVYIVYFHGKIAEHNGVEAATEFIFDAKGKGAAIAQAKDYFDIIAGRFNFFKNGGTHLWSSFHKALEFAEKKKYYRAKDDKAKTPEIVPHILLLSDGKDDQSGDGEWAYDAKKPPKNKDQIILKAHPWLPKQKAAVWYQLGAEIKVAWKGTVVIAGVGKNVDKPLNHPNATLSGPNGGTLERHQLEGGGSIAKAKINDEIKVKPVGDDRYVKFEIAIVNDKNEVLKVLPNGEFEAEKKGYVRIRIIGITKDGRREDLKYVTQVYIEGKEPPPVAVIEPDFKVLYNKVPIENGGTIWTGKKEVEVTIMHKVDAKTMNKSTPPADLDFTWNINGVADKNPNPGKMMLPVGGCKISLMVGDKKDKPANAKSVTKNFTIKQATLNVSIKKPAAPAEGKALSIHEGDEVPFQLDFVGPAGTQIVLDFGDEKKLLGMSPKEEKNPKHVYGMARAKEYSVSAKATLPGGNDVVNAVVLNSINVAKRNAAVIVFPNANPWPGDTIRLTPAAKNFEKVTWEIGDDEKPGDPITGHLDYKVLGQPKNLFAVIKFKGVAALRKVPVEIKVKKVEPKILLKAKELFIGEETVYKVEQAENGKPFPANFVVKVVLPPNDGKEKPGKKIYFTDPGEKEVEAEVTLPGVKEAFKSPKAEIIVKPIIIKIGPAPKK